MPDQLHAPWRMDYIRSLSKTDVAPGKCFLCEAATVVDETVRSKKLILFTTEHSVVMLNLFPYTNGHLLVSPKRHVAELDEMTDDELLDLQKQTSRGINILKHAISPQGFNVGINIGRCAGAGLPGHLHQHIVPRWGGDVNFMSVLGDIRIVPEALSKMHAELLKHL